MSSAMNPPQHMRARSKSTFSFKSDKSQGSGKAKLETAEEKRKSHFTPQTKADPNAAMNEVQPIAAALEKPTIQSLRSFQHNDANGNPIAEPDLSNPTRSRWERPLDTIRSFENAIDNEYKRRSLVMRGADGATDIMSGYGSRRSSYYGGGYEQNRYSQVGGGYYGSRQAAAQRESWAENSQAPNGYPRARYNRMQSDPGWSQRHSNGHNVYPTPGYQQSRDTVNTGGSNGSHSDPYSNDQSENSSIERGGPVMKPDLGEQYGFTGFGAGPPPILEEYADLPGRPSNGYLPHPQRNGHGLPPPVPAKAGPPPPPPHNPNMISLSNSYGHGPPPASGNRPNVLMRKNTGESDKRRSWFKRRFSKN